MGKTSNVVMSVDECAKVLGIARGSVYRGIIANSIPHIRVGKRILIPRKSLDALLESGRNPMRKE